MKKEYDLSKHKKRPGKVNVDPETTKTPISIRLDGGVLADLKSEAKRMGLPYQTFIGSILYRYVRGELLDPKAADPARVKKWGT